jgi:hypothetical protein
LKRVRLSFTQDAYFPIHNKYEFKLCKLGVAAGKEH